MVYTVFKELDYATSLKNGPFADSGLAKAYRGAMELQDTGAVYLTDFASYLPSYNDPRRLSPHRSSSAARSWAYSPSNCRSKESTR
ncbi:MAG: hypothetical protein KDI49_20220 [Gammaproteobacteria bacterium]|nr:hypothetical protein [Gammaproteobacteria bacterium]